MRRALIPASLLLIATFAVACGAAAPTAPVRLAPSPAATPSPGAVPATVPTAPAGSGLQSIPLALKLNGTYVQLEQFVANLEALQRVFLVGGYTLGPGSPVKPTTTSATASTATGGCSSAPCNLDLALTGQVFIAPAVAAPAVPVTLK